jgi:hypothetical protein
LLAAASSGVEGRHAVCVVEVALVIIGENFVGLFGGLESNLGFFTLFDSDLVGVVCECSLAIVVKMVGYTLDKPCEPCGMPS